ncbi:uncharacterized protein B0H18DRAFT_1019125 [Fomitopsis serialis]|uniref:uncharacterized protein n=1 Tax=Fomitopsis serialis TaxID=139415 RepID=UPI0020085974|nr:uncharacterized protein B0H18DRAFT_1019125 [Neoantrodia serialis]KAH9922104.1 hypothetical protein B0H18DRAFT_1019125 [Neoantrodia serialis]
MDAILPGALDLDGVDTGPVNPQPAPSSSHPTSAGLAGRPTLQSAPEGSAAPGTGLRIRIRIPAHLVEKQALSLANLFPHANEIPPSAASVFSEFRTVGEQFLAREETLQEAAHVAETAATNSVDSPDSDAVLSLVHILYLAVME